MSETVDIKIIEEIHEAEQYSIDEIIRLEIAVMGAALEYYISQSEGRFR